MIKPRDYQSDCIGSVEYAFKLQGYQKVLINLPTGGGKTIVMSILAYQQNDNDKCMVISHTDELVTQAYEKASFVFEDESKCGIIAKDRWDTEKTFISASIQTLTQQLDSDNFKQLINNPPKLIMIDECHHIMADTYQKVIQRLLLANPDLKILGVTATPFRMDDKNLQDFFDDMVYFIDIKELIQRGYLVPIKGIMCNIGFDFSKIKAIKKAKNIDTDAAGTELEELRDEILDNTVQKWIELAENRKTIFFTTNTKSSKNLCQKFNDLGIPSAHVDGYIGQEERKQILKDYSTGKYKILCNMNVLTEGYDEPTIECVALLRPTKSLILYTQIVGRGLRLSPNTNKTDCLVLDFTTSSSKHNLANIYQLFGYTQPEKDSDFRILDINDTTIQSEEEEQKKAKGDGIDNLYIGETQKLSFFDDTQKLDILVKINNLFVLYCSNQKLIIISKQYENNYKLDTIDTKTTQILNSTTSPAQTLESKAISLWLENKDTKSKDLFAYTQKPITLNQKMEILKFKSLNIIPKDINIEEYNYFEAITLITYLKYISKRDNYLI